ncbi:porin [Undibacterium arcticum]
MVDTYVGSMRNSGDTAGRSVVNSGGMTTSWFGFKGSEDLGGGLKAKFALTSYFKGDSGQSGRFPRDTFWSRDANVGLAGSFGAVSVGRGLAPNFLSSVIFNPFGNSFYFLASHSADGCAIVQCVRLEQFSAGRYRLEQRDYLPHARYGWSDR